MKILRREDVCVSQWVLVLIRVLHLPTVAAPGWMDFPDTLVNPLSGPIQSPFPKPISARRGFSAQLAICSVSDMSPQLSDFKALVFDVYGTLCVRWISTQAWFRSHSIVW